MRMPELPERMYGKTSLTTEELLEILLQTERILELDEKLESAELQSSDTRETHKQRRQLSQQSLPETDRLRLSERRKQKQDQESPSHNFRQVSPSVNVLHRFILELSAKLLHFILVSIFVTELIPGGLTSSTPTYTNKYLDQGKYGRF